MGGDDDGKSLIGDIYNTIVPDLDIIPDATKIDRMVDTATLACYSLTAFCISGTAFFSLRIGREIRQWRTWTKYRNIVKNKIDSSSK